MAERDYPDSGRNHLDFWQAASGAILALFVCIHLVLEGTVILTPSLTNGIAWLLEALWIAQLSAPILLLIVAVHFYIAARKMPFRTGELQLFVRHSRALCEQDTWLWLVQVFTAIIILMGVFFHVYTVMTDLPISAARSAARLHQGGLLFYVFFLPSVILHTGIGVYRLAVKYGFCTRANRALWRKRIMIGMAAYAVVGFLALVRVWFLA